MKSLVFSAATITGKEPETTNALALLSTLVKNNLDIDGLNPLRVVFGMIKPGEHQTVRSLVVPYLKDIFDDWGRTNGKTYRVYTEDKGTDEIHYVFYLDDENQGKEEVIAQQSTFAPSVVDDIFFKDEQGNLIPFFSTPKEKFETFSKALLTKMAEYLTHPNGRFFTQTGPFDHEPSYGFVKDINKHFKITLITEEEFEKFKDFLPNKVPYHISRIWMRYWVGLNRKVLVCFNNSIYAGRDVTLNYIYAIVKNEGDVDIVDVLEKLNIVLGLTAEEEMEIE